MGKRSGVETAFAVVRAFVEKRSWQQAELARRVELTVPSLRKHLAELQRFVPVEDHREGIHVFWTVPKKWHPAGVFLSSEDVEIALRVLGRAARSAGREKLIARLLRMDPKLSSPTKVLGVELTAEEEQTVERVEDAIRKRQPLKMKYFAASHGDETWRHVSVARLYIGAPSRFVGVCHRRNALRTFRIGNVSYAVLDASEAYRDADDADLARYEREAVDGFHIAEGASGHVSFSVRWPESRWVSRNLFAGMTCEPCPDGSIRVSASSAAIVPVARFVAGLAEAAAAESDDLALLVRRIAMGALGTAPARADSTRPRAKRQRNDAVGSRSE